jgi:formylglycine-generating enzyme required for sulfatase activity
VRVAVIVADWNNSEPAAPAALTLGGLIVRVAGASDLPSGWLGAALFWLTGSAISILATEHAIAQDCSQVNGIATEQPCSMPVGQPFKDCSECPEMVIAPAGNFAMGASRIEQVAVESQREAEVPVTIPFAFAVGRFPVTVAEYAAFVAATGHNADDDCFIFDGRWRRHAGASWRSPGYPQTDRHPAVCVSWEDAKTYVAWLASHTGRNYRLLSESEREYVTRAGSTTPYWWGATIATTDANYDGTIVYAGGARGEHRGGTVPVESFRPNPWGVYGVHGNIWEWVEDCWNDSNVGNPGDGSPRSTGDCSLRVHRGASWNNGPHTLRAARRERNPAGYRSGSIGFRVALTLPR